MKKITLIILLLGTTSLIAISQPYIRVNVGYSLPLNSDLIGEEEHTTYNSNTGEESGEIKGVYGSLGSGINFNAAFGNTFKGGVLGYELEVGYVISKKYSIESTYEETGFPTERSTQKSSANSFQFSPSLTFKAAGEKFQPYTRIGPVIAITKGTTSFDSDFSELEIETSGGISIGIKGAIGICFSPANKIQFFSEINFTNMAYAPKEGELKKLVIDGVDYLDDIPKEDRKVKFEKEYKFSDSSDENVEIRETYSMGSIGLQVGVRFTL